MPSSEDSTCVFCLLDLGMDEDGVDLLAILSLSFRGKWFNVVDNLHGIWLNKRRDKQIQQI